MQKITINDIKQELVSLSPSKLLELCLRLVKYKKENKELLSYLLFNSDDTQSYVESIKAYITEQFNEINTTNAYFIKKSLRKILRIINKYIKYTASKQVEAELLIYFCNTIQQLNIPVQKSAALTNLYNGQVKKINVAIQSLHEDLQYDYRKT